MRARADPAQPGRFGTSTFGSAAPTCAGTGVRPNPSKLSGADSAAKLRAMVAPGGPRSPAQPSRTPQKAFGRPALAHPVWFLKTTIGVPHRASGAGMRPGRGHRMLGGRRWGETIGATVNAAREVPWAEYTLDRAAWKGLGASFLQRVLRRKAATVPPGRSTTMKDVWPPTCEFTSEFTSEFVVELPFHASRRSDICATTHNGSNKNEAVSDACVGAEETTNAEVAQVRHLLVMSALEARQAVPLNRRRPEFGPAVGHIGQLRSPWIAEK